VAHRAGPDGLGDPGPAGHAPQDPSGGLAVEAVASRPEEDRPLAAFADGQTHGPDGARRQGDGDDLGAFPQAPRPEGCTVSIGPVRRVGGAQLA
jgi:hypothetical protein